MADLLTFLVFIGIFALAMRLFRGPKREAPAFKLRPEIPLTGIHYLIATRHEWSPQARRLSKDAPACDEHFASGDRVDGAGVIYILVNPAMPGLLKVGMTTRSAEERAKELSRATGVAAEFVVAFEQAVSNCVEAEQRVHEALDRYRYNERREYFRVSLKHAIDVVGNTCGDVARPGPSPLDSD